jgi:hypothetical protein
LFYQYPTRQDGHQAHYDHGIGTQRISVPILNDDEHSAGALAAIDGMQPGTRPRLVARLPAAGLLSYALTPDDL